MREAEYQAGLIKRIKKRLPGCMVLKNDTGYQQGIPDLTILHKKNWAVLEVKASATADHQPNQDYFVDELDKQSFGAFIYPENEEEVLDALQRSFTTSRSSRVPKS